MINSYAMRLVVLLVIGLCGCGPIVYVNEVTRHADNRVDEARAAQADKYSPYWWTRAKEYLAKSRELAAVADFQAANRFGRLAGEAADKAIEESEIAKKNPSSTTAPAKDDKSDKPVAPARSVAPAKDTP